MNELAAFAIAVVLGAAGASAAQSGAGPEAKCAGLTGPALEKCRKEARAGKDARKVSVGETGHSPASRKPQAQAAR